jgi:hypothetical protein
MVVMQAVFMWMTVGSRPPAVENAIGSTCGPMRA